MQEKARQNIRNVLNKGGVNEVATGGRDLYFSFTPMAFNAIPTSQMLPASPDSLLLYLTLFNGVFVFTSLIIDTFSAEFFRYSAILNYSRTNIFNVK